MTLLLPDRIAWDFWFSPKRTDRPYRMFHLDAPRALPDPEDRHWIATIGHAESDDLQTWRRIGTALDRGEPGAWDDRAIWTGCAIEHDGVHYLFYTALSSTDASPIQRVGVATSHDLKTWQRHPANPILTADPRWYETAATHPNGDETWRDPWVYWDDSHSEWRLLICARANSGPFDERGVVGLARSRDLITWEVLPPLTEPGEFAQLEVPHLACIADRWYLVFCTPDHSAQRLARTGPTGKWFGTHYLVADSPDGPFRLLDDMPLCGDQLGSYYAGRIETGLGPEPLFFAWRRLADDGSFVGGVSNPVVVQVGDNGALSIDSGRLWPS